MTADKKLDNTSPQFHIQGETLSYPTLFNDGHTAMAIFPVSARKADALIKDSGFKVLRLAPNTAMMTMSFVHYENTQCGSYEEIAFGFAVQSPDSSSLPYLGAWSDFSKGRYASYTWFLPVTTALSRDAGIQMWGFPKTIEDIRHHRDDDRAHWSLIMDEQEVLSFALPTSGNKEQSGVGTVYSIMDGTPQVSYLKNNFQQVGTFFRGGNLQLGTHPHSQLIRGLLLSKKPLLALWNGQLQFEMSAPSPLSNR